MNKEERENRIIARGETSNHCHVIVGDANVVKDNDKILIDVLSDNSTYIKHLIETEWLSGNEVWTKEHKDIPLKKGTYEFIQQTEYDPYQDLIKIVTD